MKEGIKFDSDDPRLRSLIQEREQVTEPKSKVSLLGFPYDIGVIRNGGRPGARQGPAYVRTLLGKIGGVYNREFKIDIDKISLTDAGDIPADSSLEDAHVALQKRVLGLLENGEIPFIIGGSNDQSYPNASALLEHSTKRKVPVAVVNIDAHLDVRPLKNGCAHSGSPFRQLLEDSRFSGSNFVEFAAQGSSCSSLHADFVTAKGGNILWYSQVSGFCSTMHDRPHPVESFRKVLAGFEQKNGADVKIFVSFDIDSIQSSDAPGVSAPATVGLSARDACEICYAAGSCPSVALVDVSEFNPLAEDYRTGRLIVTMLYYFLLGLAQRKAASPDATSK